MDKILQEILVPVITAVLIILIPVIGTLIGKLLVAILNSIKNPTIRNWAVDAVLFAEDKFGAKHGDQKLELAILFVMAKARMSHADAEKAVRAAYQNVFAQIRPKETPATPGSVGAGK